MSRKKDVEGALRQQGCAICGRVIDPDAPATVRHPQLGPIHEKCNASVSWKNLPGRSSRESDSGDLGGGYAEFEE